ncbi:MAG: hypothetical protein M1827_004924 [Pycnora praestabilis]|nr:MAG: hypothetical protein M1827_004924 [Pycnora praestabilis]
MPRRQSRKPFAKAEAAQQPTPPIQDEFEEQGESGAESHDPMEKDDVEEKLEKLVFGDDAGFQDRIREHSGYDLSSASEVEENHGDEGAVEGKGPEGGEDGIEGVDDADLFFLDSGPNETNEGALMPASRSDEDDLSHQDDDAPAWEDSDDERIMVSLASNPRLRKLRVTEAEDVVNGREYTKRLRRQFERLYPVPEWANPSASRPKNKRRRSSGRFSSSGEESSAAEDMDVDEEELSAQPLSKLLQNADDLTRQRINQKGKRGKFRPDVLDIQRTKDVGDAQPSAVTSLNFHPTLPLLLSSGPSSTLYLHRISPTLHPTPNPILTSLHMRHTPFTTTTFSRPTGTRVFISARRRFFHIWDLESGRIDKITRVYGHGNEQRSMERFKLSPCGRWMGLVGSGRKGGGVVNVLDANTCQWVAQARIDSRGGVADFDWWADGEGMCIAGKSGEISEYNVTLMRFIARWMDEGAVGTTVVSLGGRVGGGRDNNGLGGDRWVAVGSSSGIVNIYDRRTWTVGVGGAGPIGGEGTNVPGNPKPTRMLDQLVTATSGLVFSPDGQLLAVSSRWKRDALRLGM